VALKGSMKSRAVCPQCGKTVQETEVGTFSGHRRPDDNRRCLIGILDRVRVADRVHGCADCAAMPVGDSQWCRPSRPRPIAGRAGTPVRPLCHSHLKAVKAAQKAARMAADRERKRGITEEDRAALWEAQGHACACCGRRLGSAAKRPALDHCHARAATHDHPVEQACRRCARGLLCTRCNRETVGDANREPSSMVGRYIAGDNPAARLGWWLEFPGRNGLRADLMIIDDVKHWTGVVVATTATEEDRQRWRELEKVDMRPWSSEEAEEAAELRRKGANR
jgi:hypothetical protein